MAQHDMNIANQGFPATRADLNNALQALVSNSSGATEPSTTFANQWWYDTTNNKMYIRNEANNAWIEVFTLDQTNNEWQLTTGVVQAKDSDGLALKTDDGTTRLFIKDSDGAIGLGTTSPSANLHVVAPNNSQLFLAASDTNPTTAIFETDAGASERIRLNNKDGDFTVDVSNTTEAIRILNSGGLTFNGDTAAANALDDYEEGTFVPDVYETATTGTELTLGTTIGRYVKIGKYVHVTLQVGRSDASSLTGIIVIANLPFVSAATGSVTGGTFWLDKTSSDRIGIVYKPGNLSVAYLISDHAVDNYLLMTEWQNNRPIYLEISYETT